MEFKLGHLQFLLSVVDHQSVSKAADELNVTQPAVSKRILDLEKSLGVPLLDRSSRQIVPTRFGEAVVRAGKAVLAELNRISLEIEHLKEGVRTSVVVGTFAMPAAYLVPTAVMRLLEDQDDVFVSVVEDNHYQLLSGLRSGQLDFVVGAFPQEPDPELVEEVLFYDRWHAIVGADHPLVGREGLTIEELAAWEWIAPPRSLPAYREWRNMFLAEGVEPPRHRIETTAAGTVRMVLLGTDQIGYLTQQNFDLEIRAGLLAVLPVDMRITSRAFGITRRARGTLSAAAEGLMEHIREVATQIESDADARTPTSAPYRSQRSAGGA